MSIKQKISSSDLHLDLNQIENSHQEIQLIHHHSTANHSIIDHQSNNQSSSDNQTDLYQNHPSSPSQPQIDQKDLKNQIKQDQEQINLKISSHSNQLLPQLAQSDSINLTDSIQESHHSNQKIIPSHSILPSSSLQQDQNEKDHNPKQNHQVENSTEQEILSRFHPKVHQLSNMFPQIQPSILEAVLAAHGHDPTACVSDLLAMSDPCYDQNNLNETFKADQELARQIFIQEHQNQPSNVSQSQQFANLPYQPRIKKNPSNLSTPQTWQKNQEINHPNQDFNITGKDEIQKIAQEIGKFAETSKKTVSTWFNLAKAKVQELQQPQHTTNQPSDGISDYEHISPIPPTNSPLNSINHKNMTATNNRPSRISPALPYASRYQQAPSPSASIHKPISPSITSYQVEDLTTSNWASKSSSDIEKGSFKSAGNSGTSQSVLGTATGGMGLGAGLVGPQNHREEDEESLEYTRNPFEEDD